MDEITSLRAEVVQLRKMVGDRMHAQELAARTALKTQDTWIDLLARRRSAEGVGSRRRAESATLQALRVTTNRLFS